MLEAIGFIEENWEAFIMSIAERGLSEHEAEKEAERIVAKMRCAMEKGVSEK